MYKVKAVKKWQNSLHSWKNIDSKDDLGIALSTVRYTPIVNCDSDLVNYIIVADGCKVNDFTRNPDVIDENKNGIINVLNYYKKKKENYIIMSIYMNLDAPHLETAKWIAEYINELAKSKYVDTISFIGGSKCGVMAFNLMKYLSPEGLKKSYINGVSSPYSGTILASPNYMYSEVPKIIEGRLGKNYFSKLISEEIIKYYKKFFSHSQLDYDISIPGGVPKEFQTKYDPHNLGYLFSTENLSVLDKAHWQNICTLIDENTFKEVVKARDLIGIGLCILNDYLFNKKSDGFVNIDSQRSIEKYIEGYKSKIVYASHFYLNIPNYTNQVLDIVENNKELRYR